MICIGRLHFDLRPERANRDKFRKSSDLVCSRFANTICSWDFSRFGISAWSAMIEMVGGLITGFYPNLIQNAFFSSSVFIGSKCFWQTTQDKLISIHGSGKGSGTRSLGQAKALEPFARAKQKPWSHEPGSSKGSGTICLGQAKVEGRLKGQKAGTELRTPTSD